MPFLLNQILENALTTWVRATLGETNVEWQHQNTQGVGSTEQLDLPRIILSLFAPLDLSRPDIEPKDGSDDIFIFTHYKQATFSVKISAAEQHMFMADKLVKSMRNHVEMAPFIDIDAAIISSEAIQDITDALETKFCFRAQVDFQISYTVEEEKNLGEIRTIKDMGGNLSEDEVTFNQTIVHPDFA